MDWNSIGTFFNHGVTHVLQGWDHLLFASALVLALTGFWEIFKVIGVFTIAHSITAALTVMNRAPLLSPAIVEPCIAGSIVFVALENIFYPAAATSRRRPRLGCRRCPSRPITTSAAASSAASKRS